MVLVTQIVTTAWINYCWSQYLLWRSSVWLLLASKKLLREILTLFPAIQGSVQVLLSFPLSGSVWENKWVKKCVFWGKRRENVCVKVKGNENVMRNGLCVSDWELRVRVRVCVYKSEQMRMCVCLRERPSWEMYIRMCVCSVCVRETATSEIDASMCGVCACLYGCVGVGVCVCVWVH